MQAIRWTFKPGIIPTLATILLMALTFSLGQWQLNRADYKRDLARRYDVMQARPQVDLPVGATGQEWEYHRVRVRGHYLAAQQMLVDNRVVNKQAGFEVYTPLKTAAGEVVLVDRGWLPVGDRSRPPKVAVPAGEVVVTGQVIRPTGRYVELKPVLPSNSIWQNLDPARMGAMLGLDLKDFVIVAEGSPDPGLIRHFERPDHGIATHEGYALQWFLLCATLFIIYVAVNLKRKAHE